MMVYEGEGNSLSSFNFMRAKVHVTQFNLFSDMDSLNPADNNTTKSTGLVQIPVMFFNHMRSFQRLEMNVLSANLFLY